MPRTKVPAKGTRSTTEAIPSSQWNKIAQTLLENNRQAIDKMEKELMDQIDTNAQLIQLSIPSKHWEKTIGELRAMDVSGAPSGRRQTRHRRSLSLTAASDEGYRTGSASSVASTNTASRTHTRSQLRPVGTSAKPKRRSRSLSKNKSCRTPLRTLVPNTYGMITPKLKPNTPQVILRRPQRGEVAISLGGSPLMVNSISADHLANLNIPLSDGNMLSLQPHRGLRSSMIPPMSPGMRDQLLTLGQHIEKLVSHIK